MTRKVVYPDWTKHLWNRLEELARAKGLPLEFRMEWTEDPEVWFDVRVSNGKARAVVDDRVVALLDRVDKDALLARLTAPADRERWPGNAATIRASLGNTVGLQLAASTIGNTLAGRVTLNVDIHQSLIVDKASLRGLLPPDLMDIVDKETRILTLRRLGELLGIAVFKPEAETPTETPSSTLSVPPPIPSATIGLAPPIMQAVAPAPEPEVESEAEESDDADEVEESGVWRARNVIFFGPPGTGKSYQLAELMKANLGVKGNSHVIRVTFHPEYSYFDFVGNYRPVVGWLQSGGTFQPEMPGAAARNGEPRVYYTFDPGPLSLAIRAAARAKKENVVLIIEEINRGNCAAIFGDVFQLLDRRSQLTPPEENGMSEYGINPTGAWAAWLDANLPKETPAWKKTEGDESIGLLRLPRNLFIYATMNTSDQNLFPMDTAFRRRWSMQYVGVDAGTPKTLVPIRPDVYALWSTLMKPLNKAIVAHTLTDDKQMGPWFVRAGGVEEKVSPDEFASKVLFYLWSDVFRDAPHKVFDKELKTYDELVRAYRKHTGNIWNKEMAAEIEPAQPETPVTPAAEQTSTASTVAAAPAVESPPN